MAAGRAQLAFLGQQDAHLTGAPQITFFRTVFLQKEPFVLKSKEVPFNNSSLPFGSTQICELTKHGDIIRSITIKLRLPSMFVTNYGYSYPKTSYSYSPQMYFLDVNHNVINAMTPGTTLLYYTTRNLSWAPTTVTYSADLNKFIIDPGVDNVSYVGFTSLDDALFWGFKSFLGYINGYYFFDETGYSQLSLGECGWVNAFYPYFRYYNNSVGLSSIQSIELSIGGQLIETIPFEYLVFYNDIIVPEFQQGSKNAMIGKVPTPSVSDSEYYVKVPLSLENIPVTALYRHAVQLSVTFSPFTPLVNSNGYNLTKTTNLLATQLPIAANSVIFDGISTFYVTRTNIYKYVNADRVASISLPTTGRYNETVFDGEYIYLINANYLYRVQSDLKTIETYDTTTMGGFDWTSGIADGLISYRSNKIQQFSGNDVFFSWDSVFSNVASVTSQAGRIIINASNVLYLQTSTDLSTYNSNSYVIQAYGTPLAFSNTSSDPAIFHYVTPRYIVQCTTAQIGGTDIFTATPLPGVSSGCIAGAYNKYFIFFADGTCNTYSRITNSFTPVATPPYTGGGYIVDAAVCGLNATQTTGYVHCACSTTGIYVFGEDTGTWRSSSLFSSVKFSKIYNSGTYTYAFSPYRYMYRYLGGSPISPTTLVTGQFPVNPSQYVITVTTNPFPSNLYMAKSTTGASNVFCAYGLNVEFFSETTYSRFGQVKSQTLANQGYKQLTYDGRYIYSASTTGHCNLYRYDTTMPFTANSSHAFFTLGDPINDGSVKFVYSGTINTDGKLVTIFPQHIDATSTDSNVIVYNTLKPFQKQSSFSVYAFDTNDIHGSVNFTSSYYLDRVMYLGSTQKILRFKMDKQSDGTCITNAAALPGPVIGSVYMPTEKKFYMFPNQLTTSVYSFKTPYESVVVPTTEFTITGTGKYGSIVQNDNTVALIPSDSRNIVFVTMNSTSKTSQRIQNSGVPNGSNSACLVGSSYWSYPAGGGSNLLVYSGSSVINAYCPYNILDCAYDGLGYVYSVDGTNSLFRTPIHLDVFQDYSGFKKTQQQCQPVASKTIMCNGNAFTCSSSFIVSSNLTVGYVSSLVDMPGATMGLIGSTNILAISNLSNISFVYSSNLVQLATTDLNNRLNTPGKKVLNLFGDGLSNLYILYSGSILGCLNVATSNDYYGIGKFYGAPVAGIPNVPITASLNMGTTALYSLSYDAISSYTMTGGPAVSVASTSLNFGVSNAYSRLAQYNTSTMFALPANGNVMIKWSTASTASAVGAFTKVYSPSANIASIGWDTGTNIYGASMTSNVIFEYDPSPGGGMTGYRLIDPNLSGFSNVLLRDNSVVFIPYSGSNVLVYDRGQKNFSNANILIQGTMPFGNVVAVQDTTNYTWFASHDPDAIKFGIGFRTISSLYNTYIQSLFVEVASGITCGQSTNLAYVDMPSLFASMTTQPTIQSQSMELPISGEITTDTSPTIVNYRSNIILCDGAYWPYVYTSNNTNGSDTGGLNITEGYIKVTAPGAHTFSVYGGSNVNMISWHQTSSAQRISTSLTAAAYSTMKLAQLTFTVIPVNLIVSSAPGVKPVVVAPAYSYTLNAIYYNASSLAKQLNGTTFTIIGQTFFVATIVATNDMIQILFTCPTIDVSVVKGISVSGLNTFNVTPAWTAGASTGQVFINNEDPTDGNTTLYALLWGGFNPFGYVGNLGKVGGRDGYQEFSYLVTINTVVISGGVMQYNVTYPSAGYYYFRTLYESSIDGIMPLFITRPGTTNQEQVKLNWTTVTMTAPATPSFYSVSVDTSRFVFPQVRIIPEFWNNWGSTSDGSLMWRWGALGNDPFFSPDPDTLLINRLRDDPLFLPQGLTSADYYNRFFVSSANVCYWYNSIAPSSSYNPIRVYAVGNAPVKMRTTNQTINLCASGSAFLNSPVASVVALTATVAGTTFFIAGSAASATNWAIYSQCEATLITQLNGTSGSPTFINMTSGSSLIKPGSLTNMKYLVETGDGVLAIQAIGSNVVALNSTGVTAVVDLTSSAFGNPYPGDMRLGPPVSIGKYKWLLFSRTTTLVFKIELPGALSAATDATQQYLGSYISIAGTIRVTLLGNMGTGVNWAGWDTASKVYLIPNTPSNAPYYLDLNISFPAISSALNTGGATLSSTFTSNVASVSSLDGYINVPITGPGASVPIYKFVQFGTVQLPNPYSTFQLPCTTLYSNVVIPVSERGATFWWIFPGPGTTSSTVVALHRDNDNVMFKYNFNLTLLAGFRTTLYQNGWVIMGITPTSVAMISAKYSLGSYMDGNGQIQYYINGISPFIISEFQYSGKYICHGFMRNRYVVLSTTTGLRIIDVTSKTICAYLPPAVAQSPTWSIVNTGSQTYFMNTTSIHVCDTTFDSGYMERKITTVNGTAMCILKEYIYYKSGSYLSWLPKVGTVSTPITLNCSEPTTPLDIIGQRDKLFMLYQTGVKIFVQNPVNSSWSVLTSVTFGTSFIPVYMNSDDVSNVYITSSTSVVRVSNTGVIATAKYIDQPVTPTIVSSYTQSGNLYLVTSSSDIYVHSRNAAPMYAQAPLPWSNISSLSYSNGKLYIFQNSYTSPNFYVMDTASSFISPLSYTVMTGVQMNTSASLATSDYVYWSGQTSDGTMAAANIKLSNKKVSNIYAEPFSGVLTKSGDVYGTLATDGKSLLLSPQFGQGYVRRIFFRSIVTAASFDTDIQLRNPVTELSGFVSDGKTLYTMTNPVFSVDTTNIPVTSEPTSLSYSDLRAGYFDGRFVNFINTQRNILDTIPLATSNTIVASCIVEYAYVSQREKEWLMNYTFGYPIVQVQKSSFRTQQLNGFYNINFSGPVKEVIVLLDSAALTKFSMYLNGNIKHTSGNVYVSNISQLMYHARKSTESNTYTLALCTSPEKRDPSGFVNMSRFTEKVFEIGMSVASNVTVMALSYNIFNVRDGLGGLVFNHNLM
jgi:hypothetical protein